tara:strand:- start:701 stop:1027 length:327 start_codon:yes stop_codon:yes gene_type:complete
MRNRVALFCLLLSSNGFTIEPQEIIVENVAKLVTYGAVAAVAKEELSHRNFSFPYMDVSYVEQGALPIDVPIAGVCEVEKRAFALSDRTIVQYLNLCSGAVIAETTYP